MWNQRVAARVIHPSTPYREVQKPVRRSVLLLLFVLAALVAACGAGGATAVPSTAPAASDAGGGAGVIAPTILDATSTTATVKVGWFVVFKLDDPSAWTMSADKPELVELTPGTDDGSVVTNPGARALAAGTGKVTLVNGSTTLVYTLTIE
jgi:hypothetical protein